MAKIEVMPDENYCYHINDLDAGDIFFWCGNLYMKIKAPDRNAVKIRTGETTYLTEINDVEPIESAKLYISKKPGGTL